MSLFMPTSAQSDARGNWSALITGIDGSVLSETRAANGVNEYAWVDPDGTDPQPAIPLAYDPNGNLIEDPSAPNAPRPVAVGEAPAVPEGQRYDFDAANRVTRVWRTNGTFGPGQEGDDTLLLAIRYDALGRRVETAEHVDPASGDELAEPRVTWHAYLGLEVLEEHAVVSVTADSNGLPVAETALAREFIWGPRFPEPVAMIDHTDAGNRPATGSPGGSPEVLHYLCDALGHVVALVDQGYPDLIPPVPPRVVERYTYDPYGQTNITDASGGGADGSGFRSQSAFGNPWMWTGQRYDAATGTYHFHARTYSPHLGRWLQRDPLGYVDGVSLYEYAAANPLFWLDPLGFSVETLDLPWWVEWTEWMGSSYETDRKRTQTVCTVCEVAQLPADIATFGQSKLAKGILKKGVGEAVEAGVERFGKRAFNEFAEKGVTKVVGAADKTVDTAKALDKAQDAEKAVEGASRAGKPFTKKGKQIVKEENTAKNGGKMVCENCDVDVVPANKHQKGVTPPGNEAHVDHVVPKAKGGSGTADNGQVLCRDCNLNKGCD